MASATPRVREYPRLEPETVPVIEQWITLPDAADELNLSRQRAHQLAMEGIFPSLRRTSPNGRPSFMIKRTDLEKYRARRSQREAEAKDSQPVE